MSIDMKKLRQFIREELVWNYWMRRPRNNKVQNVGGEIEQQRQDVYDSTLVDFEQSIRALEHSLKTAATVSDLENTMIKFGLDAYEIVVDPTLFDNAVREQDVGEAKRQILNGLQKWASDVMRNTAEDDYNYSTLQTFIDCAQETQVGI